MTETEKLKEQAKQLVGEKALLVGGGSLMNKFSVVRVKDFEDGSPVLDAPDNLSSGDFKPILGSWKVIPMNEKFKDILDIGTYYHCGNEIKRDDCGMFGSIHDCTTVYSDKK